MKKVAQLVLVTGMSGAGKSSALHYLEDLGFFWVDNLPLALLPQFIAHFSQEESEVRRVAVGVHIRSHADMEPFPWVHRRTLEMVERLDMIFMDASFEVLVNRFRETRRRHPVAKEHTVMEAITLEASFMEPMRAMAEVIIDTTRLTVPSLKDRLSTLFQHEESEGELLIFIRSFGFKYGSNTDADMVLDGRFLANPHYDPGLRPLTGQDAPVCQFLEQDGEADRFLVQLVAMFDYLIPRYRQEKKRYFTLDIGCTGGRHRSVYLVEQLSQRLRQKGYRTFVRHRDMNRPTPLPVPMEK